MELSARKFKKMHKALHPREDMNYIVCLNKYETHVTANNSTNNNVVFFFRFENNF